MNNPKQYPKKAMLSKAEDTPDKPKVMTDMEMAAQMKKNFILARGVNKSRKQTDGTNS